MDLEGFFPGFAKFFNLKAKVERNNQCFRIKVIGNGYCGFLIALILNIGEKRKMGNFFEGKLVVDIKRTDTFDDITIEFYPEWEFMGETE